VDPLDSLDLGPLLELVNDPSVQKVTHAGRQDAEIFFNATGAPPQNLYDTQVAAALLGYGEQIGYANLVHRVLKVRLKKTERVTDWSRRPLSDAQLQYALDDVRYLPEIRDHLNAELDKLGRRDWLEEELAFYADPDRYTQDPEMLWTRVSGWRALDRRGLGILRELARWREETAASRDIPRNRVVSDDVMVEMAARRPATVEDLRPMRRLHSREIERSGKELVTAVARGEAVPEADLPRLVRSHTEDPELSLVADLMGVLLRLRAREHRIAPSYFGNSRAVLELARWLAEGRDGPPPPLFVGWRRRLVGDELARVFDGTLCLRVDAAGTRVGVEPAD
jgi:ribonuclease D